VDQLQIGARLDCYRIIEEAAAGGMATIFRAFDEENGREVALKVPHIRAERPEIAD
jgi:hypothetical protein